MRSHVSRTVLVVTIGLLGLPGRLLAQVTQLPTATVSGWVRDAEGQLITHERVELIFDDTIIDETATDRRGAWAFHDVRDGRYIVRTKDDCRVFSVRVVVTPGQDVAGVEILVPAGLPGASRAPAATTVQPFNELVESR